MPIVTQHTDYYGKELHHFQKFTEITLGLREVYQSTVYRWMYEIIVKFSEHIKKIQSGSVNTYISYMFVSLLVLLIALTFVL